MSSIFSRTLTKITAQIAALVLVVGGLAAFVITQANADYRRREFIAAN